MTDQVIETKNFTIKIWNSDDTFNSAFEHNTKGEYFTGKLIFNENKELIDIDYFQGFVPEEVRNAIPKDFKVNYEDGWVS